MGVVGWHVWLEGSVLHLDASDVLANEWEALLDSVNGALRRFEPKEVVIWVEPSMELAARGTMIAALRQTISQDGTPVRIESGTSPWHSDH